MQFRLRAFGVLGFWVVGFRVKGFKRACGTRKKQLDTLNTKTSIANRMHHDILVRPRLILVSALLHGPSFLKHIGRKLLRIGLQYQWIMPTVNLQK